MLSLFVASVLVASPPALGEISAPLGRIGNVVDRLPQGGVADSDKILRPTWGDCEPKAIYLMRFMGGTGRALEQFQQSLDRSPGSEKKLFGRKGVLSEVMKKLGSSRFDPQISCTPIALVDGYKVQLTAPPKKWCEGQVDSAEGEFWFFAAAKPQAVISVQHGETDACKPRLSAVFFDAKGAARLRLHADWGGEMSATLVGERCQVVEYTLDSARQVFVPVWKSCKG